MWFINVYHGSSLIFVVDIPLWHGLDPRKKHRSFHSVFHQNLGFRPFSIVFSCNLFKFSHVFSHHIVKSLPYVAISYILQPLTELLQPMGAASTVRSCCHVRNRCLCSMFFSVVFHRARQVQWVTAPILSWTRTATSSVWCLLGAEAEWDTTKDPMEKPFVGIMRTYPLVNIQKAIENGHLQWFFPLKMVIFHSYVSLPEGKWESIIKTN